PTPSDFGKAGEPPSNPELLDWLASVFVEGAAASDRRSEAAAPSTNTGLGWSLKKLHRLVLLSNAYQQSSASNPDSAAKDPGNRLCWRYNRWRLEAEALRDACLSA